MRRFSGDRLSGKSIIDPSPTMTPEDSSLVHATLQTTLEPMLLRLRGLHEDRMLPPWTSGRIEARRSTGYRTKPPRTFALLLFSLARTRCFDFHRL